MKSKIIVVVLSWLLVLLTMAMIFNFSRETSEKSSQTSEGVVVQILDIFMEKEEITPPVIKKYQFPIRKAAHFGIYMLLGFCLLNAFEKTVSIKLWINSIISFLVGVLYAITDEYHQNFSSGRGPQAKDVLIDSSGVLLGVLIFIGFYFLYKKVIFPKINKNKN